MEATGIGPSIHIKGTIASQEPLVVAGHVVGSIDMPGYALVIAPTASVDGDVAADGITISGKTHGSLKATSRIAVHETATVEGSLATPVISVADGASIHGDCVIEGRKAPALALAS